MISQLFHNFFQRFSKIFNIILCFLFLSINFKITIYIVNSNWVKDRLIDHYHKFILFFHSFDLSKQIALSSLQDAFPYNICYDTLQHFNLISRHCIIDSKLKFLDIHITSFRIHEKAFLIRESVFFLQDNCVLDSISWSNLCNK